MAKDQTVLFHSTIFRAFIAAGSESRLGEPQSGRRKSVFVRLYLLRSGLQCPGSGKSGLPLRRKVGTDLEKKLLQMKENGERLDVITFSGNGEPTLNPDFPKIIDDVISLRDKYYPDAKVSVLTNSTRIFSPTWRRH